MLEPISGEAFVSEKTEECPNRVLEDLVALESDPTITLLGVFNASNPTSL